MIINYNKVEFKPNSSFGDWIDMYLNEDYLESVRIFEGDDSEIPNGLSNLYYMYLSLEKLLWIRNCDVIYIKNLSSGLYDKDFINYERELTNKQLIKLYNY